MHSKWSDWIYFFIGVILPTYNLLSWIGEHFGRILKRLVVHTQRDAIVWMHYEKHAAKQRHAPKHPIDCSDDDCVNI